MSSHAWALARLPQGFELLHGPSQQMLIDVPCQGVKLGAVEDSVVADPASDHRVDLLGEAGQVRPAATVEMPVPNLLADCLPGGGADGRGEAHEVASPATGQAAPEGAAQEIEGDVLRLPWAVRVLAEHDLRLLGVQLKTEGPEPAGDVVPKFSGLFLGDAVGNDVIGITLKGQSGCCRVIHISNA